MGSEHSKNQHQSNPISKPDEKKIYKPRTAGKLKTVTVLSIDGGGTRGIIPAMALLHLEKYLQVRDKDDNLRLSDYFDVISGSGMGSIIAGMLTVPDDHHKKRPRYSMQQILDSLINEIFYTFPNIPSSLFYKIFGGGRPQDKFKQIIYEKFKGTQLNQTLSNVVIPVFNDNNKRPVILSSSDQPKDHMLLSEAVTGSSAVPGFLDPLKIKYQDENCSFIDGGLVSTNPTLFALQEAEKHVIKTEADYNNYLVLSVGTAKRLGLPKLFLHFPYWIAGCFTNNIWGDWGSRALQCTLDTFSDATEIYMTQLFQCHEYDNENYLRIQAHKEDFQISITDRKDSTIETWIKRPIEFLINASAIAHPVPAASDGSSGSINKLKTIANTNLKKPVKHINPYSCHFFEKSDQSNEEALHEFAKKLSKERERRLDELQKNKN